jgi:large subunit ribosomal protein L35
VQKLKTHSGAKKRFRITAKGKIKYKKAGLRHLLTGDSRKKKRHLRKPAIMEAELGKRLKNTYLPYK